MFPAKSVLNVLGKHVVGVARNMLPHGRSLAGGVGSKAHMLKVPWLLMFPCGHTRMYTVEPGVAKPLRVSMGATVPLHASWVQLASGALHAGVV